MSARLCLLPICSILLLAAPSAQAFCGTYVGSADASLTNRASQVVLARNGERTVLTMANDYEGELSDFAMVVPVPALLSEDDVRTVDPAWLTSVDAYSAARLVSYTCEDLHPELYWNDYDYSDDYGYYEGEGGGCGSGCILGSYDKAAGVSVDTAGLSDGGYATDTGGSDLYGSVEVESEFTVGAYDIVILSAEESGDLIRWLSDNGYGLGEDAADMLQDYIEAGSYFFAARVSLESLPEGEAWLPPLQFSYDSPVLSLPIRLGTLNSPGEQDLVVHVLWHADEGKAAISNHPEVEVVEECLWGTEGAETLGDFYGRMLDRAFEGQASAWLLEYTWQPSKCDPCTGPGPLDGETTWALGYTGYPDDAQYTRLRVRYTPEGAGQDLLIQPTNLPSTEQVRYIRYARALESDFPLCEEGWATEDPGSCEEEAEASRSRRPRRGSAIPAAIGGLFVLVAAMRRRRA